MTPLKPIENRNVRGVPATRYKLNALCAHPECKLPATDAHHAFPRSQIIGDSWFVQIVDPEKGEVYSGPILPHVTGLCREHHKDVEAHLAWIKLEGEEFVWYGRHPERDLEAEEWVELGALNPQPGQREGRAKRSRFKGEARRKRATISIKVPQDAQENGGQVWDDLMEDVSQKLGRLQSEPPVDDDRPVYYQLVDALSDWISMRDELSLGG